MLLREPPIQTILITRGELDTLFEVLPRHLLLYSLLLTSIYSSNQLGEVNNLVIKRAVARSLLLLSGRDDYHAMLIQTDRRFQLLISFCIISLLHLSSLVRSTLILQYAQTDDLILQRIAAEALSRLAYNGTLLICTSLTPPQLSFPSPIPHSGFFVFHLSIHLSPLGSTTKLTPILCSTPSFILFHSLPSHTAEAARFLSHNKPIQILIGLTTSKDDQVLRFGAMAVSAVAFASGDSSTNIAKNGGLRTLISFGYSKNPSMQAQVGKCKYKGWGPSPSHCCPWECERLF